VVKAKPQGNPNPSPETRFVAKGEESCTVLVAVRVTPSMAAQLDLLGDRKSEFIRQAIADALEHEES
jgi:hypothetical protein